VADNSAKITIDVALDDKGFKDLKKELAAAGVNLERVGDTGKLSLSKIEKSSKDAADEMHKLGGEASGTKDKIGEVGDEAKKSGEGASGVRGLIKGFTDLKSVVMAAWGAVKGLINAAKEQRQVDAQTLIAIKNNTDARSREGLSVKALADEFKKYADERQKLTGIDNASTQRTQAMLLSYGTAPGIINRVTAAFQDMAAATGKDSETIIRAWARMNEAPEEAASALQNYGIKLDAAHLKSMSVEQRRVQVLKQIEGAYRGQAQAMAEASGGAVQAEAAFGELVKTLGEGLLNALNPLILALTAVFGWLAGIPTPVYAAIAAVTAFALAWKVYTAAVKAAETATVSSGIGAALMAALKIIGLVAAGIMALWEPLKKAAEAIGRLFTTAAGRAKDLGEDLDKIKEKLGELDKKENENDALLDRLSKLEEGTAKYSAVVDEILRKNKDLRISSDTVAKGYDNIRDALLAQRDAARQANATTREGLAEEAILTYDKLYKETAAIKQSDPKKNAAKQKLKEARHELIKQYLILNNGDIEAAFADLKGKSSVLQERYKYGSGERESWGIDVRAATGKTPYELKREYAEAEQMRKDRTPAPYTPAHHEEEKPPKPEEYDLARLRIENIENEFDRRRAEQAQYYQEELARIHASGFEEALREDSLKDLRKTQAAELADLAKSLSEKEAEERRALAGARNDEERAAIEEKYAKEKDERRDQIGETAKAHKDALEKEWQEKKKKLTDENKWAEALEAKRIEALAELEKRNIEEAARSRREENEKIVNDAGGLLQGAMGAASSALGGDIKGAIGGALNMIPGIGGALSGAFGAATSLFGKLFKKNSDSVAEHFAKEMERAVEAVNAAFKVSDIYKLVYGKGSEKAQEKDEEANRLKQEKAYKALGIGTDAEFLEFVNSMPAGWRDGSDLATYRAEHGGKNYSTKNLDGLWSKLTGANNGRRTEAGLGHGVIGDLWWNDHDAYSDRGLYRENIRKYMADIFGKNAEQMMLAMGITKELGGQADEKVWFENYRDQKKFYSTVEGIISAMEEGAEAYVGLTENAIARTWGKAQDKIGELDAEAKAGRITEEEADQKKQDIIASAIEGLAELYRQAIEAEGEGSDRAKEFYRALLAAEGEQAALLGKIAGSGVERFMGQEGFLELWEAKRQLDRDIETGKARDGTEETAALQQKYLQDIIAYLKAHGGTADEIHEFEKELADISSKYYGASYAARTGGGVTPTVGAPEMDWGEYLEGMLQRREEEVRMTLDAAVPRPAAAIGYIPSPGFAARMDAARAQASITNSYNNTTTENNTVTLHATSAEVSEGFIREFDRLMKRTFGRGILRGE